MLGFDKLAEIGSKLLNNFKKLANAFLFCQGNRPLWIHVADAAAELNWTGRRFLDFLHAYLTVCAGLEGRVCGRKISYFARMRRLR